MSDERESRVGLFRHACAVIHVVHMYLIAMRTLLNFTNIHYQLLSKDSLLRGGEAVFSVTKRKTVCPSAPRHNFRLLARHR